MKKGIAFFIASIIIASFVFADELDDEIQKLEKETKLLELQKKKKELENNTSSNQNSSNASKARTKYSALKNGIFIGIEGGLGTNSLDAYVDGQDFDIPRFYNLFFSSDSTIFDLGLIGGYQHYFGESQKHGIKASAHLYSGFGNSWEWKQKSDIPGDTTIKTHNFSYIPIKFGFDVKYLWDFLERGKHTLGLNAGAGWQFHWHVKGSIATTRTGSSGKYKEEIPTIFSHGVYPVIGLHYYYIHHQFEALYRFGGILGEMGENSKVLYDNKDGKNVLRTYLLSQSYFTLNYAYRF